MTIILQQIFLKMRQLFFWDTGSSSTDVKMVDQIDEMLYDKKNPFKENFANCKNCDVIWMILLGGKILTSELSAAEITLYWMSGGYTWDCQYNHYPKKIE